MTQFSTRDVPWMKVGTVISEPVTARQAIEIAGLDWEVELRKDGFQTASGNWRVDPTKRKVVRKDTETPLGTTAPGYEILQYSEAFDFLDNINPEIVSAGSMKGGKQAFMVAKVPEHAAVKALDGEDPHDLYTVLRSSHDGTRALEVNILSLRDKCMNMMPLSLPGTHQRWSIRHTASMRGKMEQAREVIMGLDTYADEYAKMAAKLAEIELTLSEAREIIDGVVPDYLKTKEKQVDEILGVYTGSTRNGYTGTGWGVVNAVTEYHDWYRGGDNRRPETRWLQGLDGSTSKAANRAVQLLEPRAA